MFRLVSKKEATEEHRREALREILLTTQGSRGSELSKKAIAFCGLCIEDYHRWFKLNHARWNFWRLAVIIGGVVATFAGVITLPDQWIPEAWKSFAWLRGVPAGLVAIAAAFLSSSTSKQDADRQKMTTRALWNELAKFQSRASPYDSENESEDTSAFVNNVCRIVENELHGWLSLVEGSKTQNCTARDRRKDEPAPLMTPTEPARLMTPTESPPTSANLEEQWQTLRDRLKRGPSKERKATEGALKSEEKVITEKGQSLAIPAP